MTAEESQADADWTRAAQASVRALAATRQQFTVDEVHDMLTHFGGIHSNGKAMGGVMKNMVKRGVIDPQPVWQTSSRAVDRPIRVFVGTGTVDSDVAESEVVIALASIENIARVRARQMTEYVRKLRAVPS